MPKDFPQCLPFASVSNYTYKASPSIILSGKINLDMTHRASSLSFPLSYSL
jgi:hypothetical protein